jgi:hypothetical protein
MNKNAIICLAVLTLTLGAGTDHKAKAASNYQPPSYEIGPEIDSPPLFGNFVSLDHPYWPVLPVCPYPNATAYHVVNFTNYFAYSDPLVVANGSRNAVEGISDPPYPGDGSGDDSDAGTVGGPEMPPPYTTNDLHLEIALTNGQVIPTLWGTTTNTYQLLISNSISSLNPWILGEVVVDDVGTNPIVFQAIPMDEPVKFLRAHGAPDVIGISYFIDAFVPVDTNDTVHSGAFLLTRQSCKRTVLTNSMPFAFN